MLGTAGVPSSHPSSFQAGADGALHRAVSNLDHNVSEQDLNELFSNVGPLHSCVMDFDARVRHVEQAWVTHTSALPGLVAIVTHA